MIDRGQQVGRNPSRRRRRARLPKRPSKLAPEAIADLLSAPVMVRTRGVSRRMSAFEASLHSLVRRALVDRDIGAMAQIIALCERYGLLERPPELPLSCALYIIPKSWNEAEWKAMFKKHGPPPWRGPRSGLPGDPPKDSR
jgi:hypothetical protein